MSKETDLMSVDGAKQFLASIERRGGKKNGGTKKSYTISLGYFQEFLVSKMHTLKSIIKALPTNEIDVYELLDEFVTFLLEKNSGLNPLSIQAYLSGIRSFLDYYEVEINPRRFKKKVSIPATFEEDEEAIDAKDIRDILLHVSNRRLKLFLLMEGSGGPRPIELSSILVKDCFPKENTIHIRKEYTKTKKARIIFISDEAVKCLREYLVWKYRNGKQQNDGDLLFGREAESVPVYIYQRIRIEFAKVLTQINKDAKKDGSPRRKITLNSFRRFVKSVASEQASSDFSEWLIGHKKSSYWVKKPHEKLEIYKTKCMKYLTFLDYSVIESTGKGIENQLSEKDQEITQLKEQMANLTTALYNAGILKKD